jgi:hypothetical protein
MFIIKKNMNKVDKFIVLSQDAKNNLINLGKFPASVGCRIGGCFRNATQHGWFAHSLCIRIPNGAFNSIG